jgi:hypothetical protein
MQQRSLDIEAFGDTVLETGLGPGRDVHSRDRMRLGGGGDYYPCKKGEDGMMI